MIARPVAPGSSPSCGSLPSLIVVLVGLRSARRRAADGIGLTLAVARRCSCDAPPGDRPAGLVPEAAARLGVFRSARPNDMVAAGIGRTFQNIRLFQNMTAIENVLVGMHLALQANMVDALSPRRASARGGGGAERARELLALVGLRGRDDELAKNLPYGDQRRLEVARALGTTRAAAARRADGRHEPARDGRDDALIGRLRSDSG